ncbi:thioredoxin domain-containing protein [Magnetovibrio sp. PR-2]|uniref:thioredoxin domain-containing protein n=1 Tax=Magnetovibrio sp. PR-2 TaxID=3120356 RepID=UPI002FCE4D0A
MPQKKSAPKNRLALETSPYLLQHQDNPVDWFPWGEEALELSKKTGKPILLSIGYSACHWCHVMAHESFENAEIAELMNDLYINVKVDREERPDLDVIYQSALALMRQPGGWPLTMFLTPEGEPFWGGTYFPPEPRYGRPGFGEVLSGIAGAWEENRDQVTSNVAVIREALVALSDSRPGEEVSIELLDEIAGSTLRAIDPMMGGFRGAPKFPQVPILNLLWRAWQRTGLQVYKDAVTNTLDHMCQGGIFDHIGGGFARYSTDENWLVPHFEKMLYDNAQLVELMSLVWAETKSPLYKTRIGETLDWVLRDMCVDHPDGGFAFATALDADTEGKEGTFYTWTLEEIDERLGELALEFKRNYTVTERGNWEDGGKGANVIARSSPYPLNPVHEAALEKALDQLFDAREDRAQPGRDDKVLADVNGLMIQALARAGSIFDNDAWVEAAETAFGFVSKYMVSNGRLSRSWAGGEARHNAVLDDCAQMARAALTLYEATGLATYLAQGEAWTHQASDLFWCADDGGYCLSARDVTDVITRTRQCACNAQPSGNGTMADVLARLYLITGNDDYRERAEDVINAFPAESPDSISNMPTLMNAYELLSSGTQVIIAASNGDARPMVEAVHRGARGPFVLVRTDGQEPFDPSHVAFGKTLVDGKAAAYVCRAGTCSAPVANPDDLRSTLKDL